jgi:hypothetical protein
VLSLGDVTSDVTGDDIGNSLPPLNKGGKLLMCKSHAKMT